jgi:putative copper export protein
MRRRILWLSVSATWLLLTAGPALAAGDGEQVGKNLGDLLGSWSKSLYGGIAGLVALVFLMNRRFADLAVFMVAAVLVGGFVMAPGEIASTVRDIWHTISG